MGSLIFALILFFVIIPLIRGIGKNGNKGSQSGSGAQQRENAYLRRLTPEQRAQIEKMRNTVTGTSSPIVPRAGDLLQNQETAVEDNPYAESFYDEEWEEPVRREPVSHDHESLDCAFDDEPAGYSSGTQNQTFDGETHGSVPYTGDRTPAGTKKRLTSSATLFQSSNRLQSNHKWKSKPPLITPMRPLASSATRKQIHTSAQALEAVEALGEKAPPFNRDQLRQAVVMSEVLKRPRFGVAPRYR